MEAGQQEPEDTKASSAELFLATLASYRCALLAMGNVAEEACPAVGSELQQDLASVERRLVLEVSSAVLKESENHIGLHLQKWGERSAEYLKTKASEVKELLAVLSNTADSVGKRDQRYEQRLNAFTTRLRDISNLDDLSKVRVSLVQGAAELKTCVDQMAEEGRQAVAQLKSEITTYETKLKAAEQLAAKDLLTGLATRRFVEERVELRIQDKQVFCVAMIDLNRLKHVNDSHGHLAGDQILKQFAQELRSSSRPTDIVGRWGGDEFIIILDCDLEKAKALADRMLRWAFGEYTIQPVGSSTELKVHVDASIGMAEWKPGEGLQQVVERADAEMYKEKALAHKQGG
jgi:diguanylate cyclase (GGDEF)-like protein